MREHITDRAPRLVLAAAAIVTLAACNPFAGPAAGSRHFSQDCAACHGDDARGGPGGPDLTTLASRNNGVFPQRDVLDRLDGYGRGWLTEDDAMPEFGHLMSGRLTRVELDRGASRLVPERMVALMAYLERVQRP